MTLLSGATRITEAAAECAVEQSFDLPLETASPGTVRDLFTQQPLDGAAVTALGAPGTVAAGTSFTPWPAVALGQPNPQLADDDGEYSFYVPGGISRLDVHLDGYQPYRSWDVFPMGGLLASDVKLTPQLSGPAAATVYVTDDGFEPAVISVPPRSIVEWINIDLDEHGVAATGAAWESGVLAPGKSYRVRLGETGSYTYVDSAQPLNTAVIIVQNHQIFLPFVNR